MGIRSSIKWEIRENKENEENNANKIVVVEENQQSKKEVRNNYNLLKWLINYSRFAAKLLPKLELINLSN